MEIGITRSAAPASPGHRLIFLHVPKTAGTTLWLILRRQYSPGALLRLDDRTGLPLLTEQQWRETRVLTGHLAYGAHHFAPHPAAYVTVLREPLERTLSHYCHWVREAKVPVTLGEYLSAGMPWTDNLQTRLLAGPEAEALPFGQCGREVFEEAKRHLNENIAVTGLTERFDETLILLQCRFGWNTPCYVPENVGANRIDRDAVPRELLRQIWEMTEWDRALYALAAARLEGQIAQAGPAFAASLRQFRLANVRYRRMKALAAAGPIRALKSCLSLERQMGMERAVRGVLGAAQRFGGRRGAGGLLKSFR